MITINIARDFSRFPGGRYARMSKHSGEEFRDQHLRPALKSGSVRVELDGVRGYGSSFLEEAFGGLVREMQWHSRAEVDQRLELITSSDSIKLEINQYINEALEEVQGLLPA